MGEWVGGAGAVRAASAVVLLLLFTSGGVATLWVIGRTYFYCTFRVSPVYDTTPLELRKIFLPPLVLQHYVRIIDASKYIKETGSRHSI